MSLLDDLKKQAEDTKIGARPGSDSGDKDTTKKLEENWRKLRPVFAYLKHHFTELAETLNVLESETLFEFELDRNIKLRQLKSQNFKITAPKDNEEREFNFEFENVGEIPTNYKTHNPDETARLKSLFKNNGINFAQKPDNKNQDIFQIKPKTKTTFQFVADVENNNIKFSSINYERLWTQVNYYTKEKITQELMDEMTKFAMRQPNRLNELSGNVVSDDVKTKLRAQLIKEGTIAGHVPVKKQTESPAEKKKSGKFSLGGLFKK